MRLFRTAQTALLILLISVGAATAGAMEDAADAYARGDYATALRLTRPLADQGDRYAQFYLGLMYEYGWGVPQDYEQAVTWYREAGNQGLAEAQNNLGGMYFGGKGVPLDNVHAYMWYNLSAAQGFKYAISNRSSIMRLMTPSQITEAQKLAREWKVVRRQSR